jgi:antirestriction protein ArdC
VRKGEHGTPICKLVDWTPKNGGEDGEDDERHVRTLKHYTVFNVAQCDNLPVKITESPLPKPRHHDARDPVIEEFLVAVGVKIHEEGNRAVYVVNNDQIVMPPFRAFDTGSAYYVVLFHELGHWTGAKHRLDRDLSKRFEPRDRYAAEELVAELASAFLCAEFSIDGGSEHSSYIGHWITLLKSDPKALFTCASRAQAAVDYLRDLALHEPAVAAE